MTEVTKKIRSDLMRSSMIDRWGERKKFDRLVENLKAIDEGKIETTGVKAQSFFAALLDYLNNEVDESLPIETLLTDFIDRFNDLAEEYDIVIDEFNTDWTPIRDMYVGAAETQAAARSVTEPATAEATALSAGETHDMAETDRLAAELLAKQYQVRGIQMMPHGYRETMEQVPTVFEFCLFSILDEAVQANLRKEYDNFAHGPSATLISGHPDTVENYAEQKRILDSEMSGTWHLADALNQVDWSYSILGLDYWTKLIAHYDSVR